ncbi:unnamed protein product [Agarophyton chilense]|eukprot:gb/GEZJ01003667.1/.p1 GENE.gb/GEZJ01003667.1/~~gb/GEZJ01003667.1/.p1  ORF type:complete len:345 (+),score=25.07 gb/GEZJ01003667.1/:211-1245(+)
MSTAFVATLPRVPNLRPHNTNRNSHAPSTAFLARTTRQNKVTLGSHICTLVNTFSTRQLSRGNGGGDGIPVQKQVRSDDGDDDNNHIFSSSAFMLLASKAQYLSQRRLSPNGKRPNPSLIKLTEQLRVCQILLAVNIAVFLLQVLSGPEILMAGAKVNSAIANGQYYRLFSPMFLHASATHLAINSFSLHSTGPSVESWFGKKRFLWLYLLSGVCGNALSFACTPTPAVGASGAIFGLVGASAVVLARHSKLLGPRARKGLQSLAYIVVMNFGMGLSPGSRIDNFGHLGGFLGGIAYSYVFGPRFVARRLRSGRTIIQDEPISSLVMRDIRNHVHSVRRLLNLN